MHDVAFFNPGKMMTVGQITDSYLLALAAVKNSKLATLDQRLSTLVAKDGAASLLLITC